MGEIAAAWANFFVAEVGAAAALSGLVIVAISINLQRILSFPQLPGRAAEMLIMLVGALFASSFALMPGQPLNVLGGEMLGAGLLMTAPPIAIQAPANSGAEKPADDVVAVAVCHRALRRRAGFDWRRLSARRRE